jgi:hypothetical protein
MGLGEVIPKLVMFALVSGICVVSALRLKLGVHMQQGIDVNAVARHTPWGSATFVQALQRVSSTHGTWSAAKR